MPRVVANPVRESPKRSIKQRLQDLLSLVREVVETPGMNWVDANNAIYCPGGPAARLFASKADRTAFAKAKERKQIDDLIDSLPEPPLRPEPKQYSGKFNVRIPKSLHGELVREAKEQGVSLNQLVLAKLAMHLQTG